MTVPAARIAVTTGSSAAFNLAFITMFDPGDRVAVTVPGYPAYRNILKALDLEVVEIATRRARATSRQHCWREAHRRRPLKGVLFASPANPTGAIIPADELERLLATAAELGIAAISDEIYHRLSYAAPDMTALSLADDVTVINSFSKYYCMTGWRIGWMVLPRGACAPDRVRRSRASTSRRRRCRRSPPSRAFEATAELDAVKERYRESRALLMKRLPELGFRLAAPMDGAFYAYCDVSRLTNDSMDFAARMLAEAHVAATPGKRFRRRGRPPLHAHVLCRQAPMKWPRRWIGSRVWLEVRSRGSNV